MEINGHMSVQLPISMTAAGTARRLIRDTCHGLPEDLTDAAVLLTSEAVTGSVLRSRLYPERPAGPITLSAWRDTGSLRVEVHDRARGPVVSMAQTTVASLAADWGSTSRPSAGTIVWFVLEVSRGPVRSPDDRYQAVPPVPHDHRRTGPARAASPRVPRQRTCSWTRS